MMISTPTASGKTLIAMMTAYNHVRRGGKCLYLTPLRALAGEKLEEFRRLLKDTPYKAVASTGDYDSSDPWLANYDVIIATNEKADSLIRHGAKWIDSITLVVADEIHLLGDPDRGPTLEMTLTKLLDKRPDSQMLALSATARNAGEIAEWLGSELISMEWRPVPLREGVFLDGEVEYSDGSVEEVEQLDYDPAIAIALKTVVEGGQALIFAMTRRKAEKYAEKAAEALNRHEALTGGIPRDEVIQMAREYLEEDKSSFTDKLVKLMLGGAAFHHAGLGARHRRLVERAFRERVLKILAATPTLAAGVNLPARTVVIPELWRYEAGEGMRQIDITEYKQFCGRAGRPGYDEYGQAITIARKPDDKEIIIEKYIRGKPERIWSRLGSEKHLRIHVLAVIAAEDSVDEDVLKRIFSRTFFSHQYGYVGAVAKISKVMEFLLDNRFIKYSSGVYTSTRLGKRVSQLYIDPLTALTIIEFADKLPNQLSDWTLLQVICSTPDTPRLGIKIPKSKLEKTLDNNMDKLVIPDIIYMDPDEYSLFLERLKLMLVLKAWIDEVSEGEIYDRYRVEPGDLAVLRERGAWIAYAASELMKILEKPRLAVEFSVLSERIEHGVNPELLQLARLHGVGRVRARQLYNSGYRTLEDLRRASVEELARVPTIGARLAQQIKEQIT
ncbi:MAG TPA: DEAD/DEAH box helicase [Candidatus Caldiarchaeum subterraneum]|uniref:ATP-dependent DNA helicase Hel308 n=1 Tax=Caldiarchaeum subterraneum TaxID=311458 RepID=A0A833A4R4_CALS0|nr:DEAD/DEAH box helicase [Candidatus Caldarchaeum subterraneum]